MAKTIRLRCEIAAVLEYDANPRDYDTNDPVEIVRMDQATAQEDAYLFLDNPDTQWKVKVSRV